MTWKEEEEVVVVVVVVVVEEVEDGDGDGGRVEGAPSEGPPPAELVAGLDQRGGSHSSSGRRPPSWPHMNRRPGVRRTATGKKRGAKGAINAPTDYCGLFNGKPVPPNGPLQVVQVESIAVLFLTDRQPTRGNWSRFRRALFNDGFGLSTEFYWVSTRLHLLRELTKKGNWR